MARRSARRELNNWLDHHGYRHAQASTPTTTARPYRMIPAHARRKETPALVLDETTSELLRDASYGPGEYVALVATAKPATNLQESPTLATALEQFRRQPDHTMGFISKALAYSKAMPSGKRDHANLIRLIKGGFVKIRKVNGPPPEGSTAWRDSRYGDRYYELYPAD